MRSLMPFLSVPSNRRGTRDVVAHDLIRAHAFGPRLLESWRRGNTEYWRVQSTTFVVGGLVPLLGALLFDWSLTMILVSTSADLCFVWLGDWLKIWLAAGAVRREVELDNEGDRVDAAVQALHDAIPLRYDVLGLRVGGVRVPRAYDEDYGLARRMLQGLLGLTCLLVVSAVSMYLIHQSHPANPFSRPSLWLALALCMLFRFGESAGTALGWRGHSSERPELLPNTMAPAYLLMLSLMIVGVAMIAYEWLMETLGVLRHADPFKPFSLLFLLTYLVVSLFVAHAVRSRLRQREQSLRAFMAVELDRHIEKLQRMQPPHRS